jgi:D-glycero-alpha-D-manno-heptose-7-phosphate kinase
MINKSGSVRVDLLGGTLDLNPINLILPNVVTLNLATSLKAKVLIEKDERDGVEIVSKDYNSTNFFKREDFERSKLQGGFFKELTFVCQILDLFGLHSNIKMTLESGSPPGAGLGGSSAMGVTIYSALCEFTGQPLDKLEAITKVNSIESIILDSGPAGYQDYYPALFGGVLALTPRIGGIDVHQLYDENLKAYLEENITLVFSGETRNSGINNWEVYKGFFDKLAPMREGLEKIAKLSHEAYGAIQSKNWARLVELISAEGATRSELFPGIVSPLMDSLYNKLKKEIPSLGLKVCGAGGGGCFLLIHPPEKKSQVLGAIKTQGMTVLDFILEPPLN